MSNVPTDFAAALKNAGLDAFFRDCTPSHQREYLKHISEAKKPETRAKRIAGAVVRISAKRDEEEAKQKKRRGNLGRESVLPAATRPNANSRG